LSAPVSRRIGSDGLKTQAQTYKLRFVTRIVDNHPADWVHMAKEEIRAGLRKGRFKKETKLWSVAVYLLLKPPVHFKSKTIRSLLRSWEAVYPKLKLEPDNGALTRKLTIMQAYSLFRREENFSQEEY
jgi:hypothetical protein